MRAPARPLALATLLLGLGACGDSPSQAPAQPAPPAPPGVPPEVSARLREAMKERVRDGSLGSLPAAMGPLTAADVELYLKVHPLVRQAAGELPAVVKVLEAHGLTAARWAVLQGRVTGAAMGLKHGQVPQAMEGDVEVVAPYKQRVLEGLGLK